MRSKKTFIWIISIIILISITGILYVYYLFNKTSHLPEHIPANASLVVYVNTQILIKKSLGGDTDTGQLRALREALKNSPYFKGIKDPRDLGIDIFSGAAFVSAYNIMYGIIPLSDAKKFKQYFQQRPSVFSDQLTNYNAKNVLQFTQYKSIVGGISIAFNEQYAIIFQDKKVVSDLLIQTLLNVPDKESFKQSDHYTLAHNDSAGIWFYADKKWVASKSDIKGLVQFRNKNLTITASDLAANGKFPFDQKDLSVPTNTFYTAVSGEINNPLNAYISRLGFLCGLGADDDNFERFDFKNHRNLLYMNGPKTVSTKHIHYEYDDNFNKREVIQMETDTIEACAMLFDGPRKGYFSNFNEADTNLMDQFDNSIGTYVTMDESILKYIAPVKAKFKLKAWQRNIQSLGYYYFELHIKDIPMGLF